MSWNKLIFALVVILLYIPLVFMGANVFFPEYTGENGYFRSSCYEKPSLNPSDNKVLEECLTKEEAVRKEFEAAKQQYNSWKYFYITLFNLIALILILFLALDSSILTGIFVGAVITSFVSTWIYFEAKSKLGFGTLILIFILTIYFINKKKDLFFKSKEY